MTYVVEYFNRNQAFPANGIHSGLPAQAIPTKNKTKEWFKATMDALEQIGLRQMDDNKKFNDFYRMKDSKLSFMELKDVIPYLKDVSDLRKGINIPSFLKHYDIIGTIVNAFVGWLGNMSDKYNVVGLDESEVNQYSATKEKLLYEYIQETLDQRLKQELLERGIDPEFNNFESDEERMAYLEQIQNIKTSMTPPEIENFMNTKWKTVEVMWASHTLENDRSRFYMDEMDMENFVDFILTGRCFRNFHIGHDYYKPEVWSPKNTFYSRTLDCKYPQYGEYIGRVHYYTATDIITRWGHLINAKMKQKLIGGYEDYVGGYDGGVYGGKASMMKSASMAMLYQNQVIPFKGYHDYASIKGYENNTGIPQGMYHGYDSDGNEYTKERFMPNIGFSNYSNNAEMLTDDINIRNDLYQVTESYWVSPQQIFMVTYQSETGLVTQEIVTDELLQDFLKENGIKKITRTMKEGTKDPEVNTYFVDYVPKVRYGVKITGGGLGPDNLYLDGEQIDHQIKGDSNLYDFVLPVAGYVGTSLAAKIQPYQVFYNFAINQINNILEKEIGVFFLADINFIPSQYKDLGEDAGDIWANLMDVAKDVGVLTIDTSAQNTKGNVPFNQFAKYDLTQTEMLRSRMELAEWAKSKCFEMIGITPQAINGPSKYETAAGVQQGVTASMLQTQIYFDSFGFFKRRALDIHLAVAQQCQEEGKDISVMYTKSDLTRAFLSIGTDGLSMRHMGVQAMVNSKKREELERFKNYMMQLNTAGGDIYDLASIFTSDSMVELIQVARNSRKRAEAQAAAERQNQQQIASQQIQARSEEKEADMQLKLAIEDKKGQYGIIQERIQAAGRAADSKSDAESLKFLSNVSNQAMIQSQNESNTSLEEKKISIDEKYKKEQLRIKMEELKQNAQKLSQRAREDSTKRYVAGINKN